MNIINNCLERIEREEKNMVSSISSHSKIGSTLTQNQKNLLTVRKA